MLVQHAVRLGPVNPNAENRHKTLAPGQGGSDNHRHMASELDREATLAKPPSVKEPFESYVGKRAFYIARCLPGPPVRPAPIAAARRHQSDSKRMCLVLIVRFSLFPVLR